MGCTGFEIIRAASLCLYGSCVKWRHGSGLDGAYFIDWLVYQYVNAFVCFVFIETSYTNLIIIIKRLLIK